jgi:hypothetical protein
MTPRIKKAYRHFNAFLQHYQCKQSFWRGIQKEANRTGLTYLALKTKLLCCSRPQDWVLDAFTWPSYPLDKTTLTWGDLDRLWNVYSRNHNYFIR